MFQFKYIIACLHSLIDVYCVGFMYRHEKSIYK